MLVIPVQFCISTSLIFRIMRHFWDENDEYSITVRSQSRKNRATRDYGVKEEWEREGNQSQMRFSD